MKRIPTNELKQIELSMLDSFKSVCEKNHLRYFLDYGTLIGCIRHKGFIPWDDDIDVSMPREDYDKLKSLFIENELLFGQYYKLSYIGGKYDIKKPYFNLVDIRTITTSLIRKEKYFYPIWIDIFPMDYHPKDLGKLQKEQDTIRRYLHWMRLPLIKQKSVLKSIFDPFMELLSVTLFKKAEKAIKTNAKDEGVIANCFIPSVPIIETSEVSSFFDNYTHGSFEGKDYRIPENYHQRLTRVYGDYMKYPPKEQQIPHFVEAYWKDEFSSSNNM